MLLTRFLAASLSFALLCLSVHAQPVKRNDEVKGMAGTAKVMPNANLGHTVVAFTSNVPLNATSNQIVFVLQEQNSAVPSAWSGAAKVLTGDGIVAIVPDDASEQKILFKFTDRDSPPPLSVFHFQVFDVIRYSEIWGDNSLNK
jgi:hypothetical protein